MALLKCKDCNKEFSTDAKRCPNCGAKRSSKIVTYGGGVIIFVLFFAWLLHFSSDGTVVQSTGNQQIQEIYNQVASDAVTQYEIATRHGNAMDICVQAQLVSAAYLQAKDEAKYQKWKSIETENCLSAGLQ